MSTNLSDFIGHIKKNSIARINRYRVQFTLPDGLVFKTSENLEKTLSLTCLITDIPGVSQQTTSIGYGNYDRKIVFGRSTNDLNTTFLLTGKYTEKRIFDAWNRLINDETQHAVEYYDNYVAGVYVECLNEQDDVVYSFELTEAYPINIGSLKLDRTAQNQQMALDITWAYHKINFGLGLDDPEVTLGNPITGVSTVAAQPTGILGKLRLLPIPGIDSMSASVQSAASVGSEFRSQLQGVLAVAQDVREQVRDAKMSSVNGVKILNGVVKDVKKINNVPTQVKNEVVAVVTDTKNQIGYLKNDANNISNYARK